MTCHGYANGCGCAKCNRRARSWNTRGVQVKEVRQVIDRDLTPNGFRRVEDDSNGHFVFWHPEHSRDEDDTVTLPATPRGWAWSRNALAAARRINPDMPRPVGRRGTGRSASKVVEIDRAGRLIAYAEPLGVVLTRDSAEKLLDRAGNLQAARTYINRIVAAKRRDLTAA